jgi:F0F1-type ATP synthase assembly protein I
LETDIRRLLLSQVMLVAGLSAVLLGIFDLFTAGSALFGGGIAMMNAALVDRCTRRDAASPERTPQQSLAAIYMCVVQRFLLAALMFAFGLGVMKLTALALLAGFIAGQFVMVVINTQHLTKK